MLWLLLFASFVASCVASFAMALTVDAIMHMLIASGGFLARANVASFAMALIVDELLHMRIASGGALVEAGALATMPCS